MSASQEIWYIGKRKHFNCLKSASTKFSGATTAVSVLGDFQANHIVIYASLFLGAVGDK